MKRVFLSLGILAIIAGPGVAFDIGEAETVVAILEQLADERGESVYVQAAADWFEFDAETSGLIAAAGYDEESWTLAYDALLSGYMAAIPEAEYEAMISGPMSRLEASALSEEQKALVREEVERVVAEAREQWQVGTRHADVVRPLVPRLDVLVER